MSQERPNHAGQEQSNAPKTPEMRIAAVDVTEYRSGIPIQGWASVKEALYAFASGKGHSSRATEDHNVRVDGELGGGRGGALFHMGNRRENPSSFVDRMLEEAQPSVKERGRWSRHFDYDGQGFFRKTSVEITGLNEVEDGYLLGLNAVYVGKEVEDGLAESLGVEQGLQWKGVKVVLEPDGQRFRIDFNQVAQRLQSLYSELQPAPKPRNMRQRLTEAVRGKGGRPALTGEAILWTILPTDKYDGDTNPFVLGVEDGVKVSLNLGKVGDRIDWRDGNREQELWRTEGAELSGPLAESYGKQGGLEPPSISFRIKRYSEDKYDRLPAIDPQMKTKMNELASKVSAAFQ